MKPKTMNTIGNVLITIGILSQFWIAYDLFDVSQVAVGTPVQIGIDIPIALLLSIFAIIIGRLMINKK